MNQTAILAHRGWWQVSSEKNAPKSLERALAAGFGIETDLRDLDGRIFISHDPPTQTANLPDITWFLDLVRTTGSSGRLALNIKADGLQSALITAFEKSGLPVNQSFAFDMSVPDTRGYLATTIPVYTRISEFEDTPAFLDQAQGVWVDNFTGDFPQIERAIALMDMGLRTTLVSPELHGRDHWALWNDIVKNSLHENPLFELCTDFPQDAANMLGA